MLEPREAIDRMQRRRTGGPAPPGSPGPARQGVASTPARSPPPPRRPRCAGRRHLQGDPVPVLVRWSNALGARPRPRDTGQDVRGMAVSFRPDLATAAGAFDLLGQTAPRFPVRTPGGVRRASPRRRPSRRRCRCSWPATPRPVLALLANARARSTAPPTVLRRGDVLPASTPTAGSTPDGDRSLGALPLAPAAAAPTDRLGGHVRGPRPAAEEIRGPAGRGTGALRPPGHRWPAPGDDPDDPTTAWTRRPGAQRRRRSR